MAACRSTTEIEYKQIAKGKLDMSVRRQLEQDGVIPHPTWQNWHFATWDVECFMEKRVNAMGREVSVHRLVSIGIKTSFGDTPEHYIERENMDPIEVRPMMEEFLTTLTFMHAEMLEHIPESIIKKEKGLRKIVKSKDFKNYSVADQSRIRNQHNYLADCLKLRVISWNGERYDNNVVWAPLLDILQYCPEKFDRMSIIRRGTGIMQFEYGELLFRDFLNYSCPMSLDKFALSCGIESVSKTTFPYEYYHDIAELRNVTKFPPYSAFQSSLGKVAGNFSKELVTIINENLENGKWKDVEDVKKYFEFSFDFALVEKDGRVEEVISREDEPLANLLHTSPAKFFNSKEQFATSCQTMSDYLRLYNLNDVILLEECVRTYAKGFFDSWQINIHDYMSLPGVSQGEFLILVSLKDCYLNRFEFFKCVQ